MCLCQQSLKIFRFSSFLGCKCGHINVKFGTMAGTFGQLHCAKYQTGWQKPKIRHLSKFNAGTAAAAGNDV